MNNYKLNQTQIDYEIERYIENRTKEDIKDPSSKLITSIIDVYPDLSENVVQKALSVLKK